MPTQPNRSRPEDGYDSTESEDEPIPRASEDAVLEETARLVREGRKEREADPREPKNPTEEP
ncbi:MAG TPA: hypothetical protein VF522_14130 [Ramlibacter sp.]|uniref:hypothetical protein n=1 Tax=Ramlibacter sp. TaxID=1917967 RepID=UPI002ED321D1